MWESYISDMPHGGIKLTNENDSIHWSDNTVNGEDSTCLKYRLIVSANSSKTHDWLHAQIWAWHLSLKVKCFIWLSLGNCILTSDNLLKKGWCGPNICCLCSSNEENVNHMFINCSFVKNVRVVLSQHYNIAFPWCAQKLDKNLNSWYKQKREFSFLPVFYIWNLLLCRNAFVFDGENSNVDLVCHRMKELIASFQRHYNTQKNQSHWAYRGSLLSSWLLQWGNCKQLGWSEILSVFES